MRKQKIKINHLNYQNMSAVSTKIILTSTEELIWDRLTLGCLRLRRRVLRTNAPKSVNASPSWEGTDRVELTIWGARLLSIRERKRRMGASKFRGRAD